MKGNQESAMSKSDGHSKIVIFDKYDVNAIESVFLMENECPTENEGIIYRLLRKSHLKEKEEIINKNIAPKKELKPVPIKLKCPLGYIFGEDNGKFPECDTCEIVDECGEMQHYMKYPNQYSSNSDVT